MAVGAAGGVIRMGHEAVALEIPTADTAMALMVSVEVTWMAPV